MKNGPPALTEVTARSLKLFYAEQLRRADCVEHRTPEVRHRAGRRSSGVTEGEVGTRRKVFTASIFIGLVIAVLATAAFVIPDPNGQTTSATANKSEHLTEIYFNDHLQLPTTYVPGATETVEFTIHNLEGATVAYSYDVKVNGTVTLPSQSTTLVDGAAKQLSVDVVLNVDTARAEVQIELTNVNQYLDFWVNKA